METKDTCNFPGGVFELKIYKSKWHERRGIVQQVVRPHNKMTNASLAAITGLAGNTGGYTAFTYLAVGTSSTAVSAAHTALQAEISTIGLSRNTATVSQTTGSQTNDTLSLTYTWTASGSTTIQEIGVFNASSSGTMLARALTGSVSVVSGNSVVGTYTWKVVGN